MAAEPIILNPIGWANLRLLGGWKRTLVLCSVYFGASWVILLLLYQAVRRETTARAYFGGALVFFIFIQASILFFGGANAVKRAIQRDFTSDMISSHRLTAMSGATAIFGYLTGPTIHVVALVLTTWLTCTCLAVLAESAVSVPTSILVITACDAILFWTLTALAALHTRGRLSIIGVIIGIGVASNLHFAYLIPAFPLLLPASLISMFTGPATGSPATLTVVVSMIAQLALAFTFFLGAARRYTRDDVPAFSGVLAYAFLAVCSLIAAVGFHFVPSTTWAIAPTFVLRPDVEVTATLIGLMIMALVPVAAAAKDSALWARQKRKDPQLRRARPRPYYESAIICTLIIAGILIAVLFTRRDELFWPRKDIKPGMQVACSVAILLLSLLTAGGVLHYCYRVTSKVGWVMALVVVLLWLIPMFADLSLETVLNRSVFEHRTGLFTSSPIGAWIACLTDLNAPLIPGLAAQALITAGALLLGRRAAINPFPKAA